MCGVSAYCRLRREAGAGRAGEQQPVQPRMGGERLADLRPALTQRTTSSGTPALVIEADQILAHGGGLLARAEDDCIAGEQSGHDVAVGQSAGKL